MFMAYEGDQLNDVTIFRAMEIVAARQGLAVLHAENFDIVKELRREIRSAKARGQTVYGEVCVAYLVYTRDDYARTPERGHTILVGPPIREARHQAALWQALADGTLDIVSSDHRPRPRQPGQPGTGVSRIEARLALVYHFGVRTGRLSRSRWLEVCCTNPAKIFGLPWKGQLLPGYDGGVPIAVEKRDGVSSRWIGDHQP
jgi:dihydropyrimidinase